MCTPLGLFTVTRQRDLIFLALPDPELALARVAERVAQGGHDVPEATVRRRFVAGIRNFHGTYKGLVDMWQIYDNSILPPMLIAEGVAREDPGFPFR